MINKQSIKISLKKKILEVAFKKHQMVIQDFQQRIGEMVASEKSSSEEEYDSHQQSFNMKTIAEADWLNGQLQFANHEWDELMKIESNVDGVHNTVDFGSVVRTDRDTFFISSGIEKFYVDGKPYLGLSVNSPLYQAMKGRKSGDTFQSGNRSFRVLEIF